VRREICFILIDSLSFAAYSLHSLRTVVSDEPVDNFSTVQAKDVVQFPLRVPVSCAACSVAGGNLVTKVGNRSWAVICNDERVKHCEDAGIGTSADESSTYVGSTGVPVSGGSST